MKTSQNRKIDIITLLKEVYTQLGLVTTEGSGNQTSLATAPCEHHRGQLTSESQFRIIESSRSYKRSYNKPVKVPLKYRCRSCITENIALGAWSRENKALGCAPCFIGSRPRPCAIIILCNALARYF